MMDPFCGTGTSLDAAASLGFSTVGVDLDPPEDIQMSIGASVQQK
jgi:tRNA G10  N-methylase Trm11